MNAGEFAKRRALIDRERGRGKQYAARALNALIREAKAVAVFASGRLVAWRLPNGQIVCRKRRYAEQLGAELALSILVRHSSAKKVPCRVYMCDYCRGWHLTSQVLPK